MANSSETPRDYRESLVDDRVRVETRSNWLERFYTESKTRKPPTGLAIKLSNGTVYPALIPGLPVKSGQLQGYDMGEFGGGIYWISRNGKEFRKVNDRNTQIVGATSKGVYAVQALQHLQFWYAALVKVSQGAKGWQVRTVTDLHTVPSAIVQDGDRFVYAAENYLSTLELSGAQHEIYRSLLGMRIGSMIRRRNGEIWGGASKGLIRLSPQKAGGYAVQWFTPSE